MRSTTNAVSVLTWRARRALRVAYLQAHVNPQAGDQRCRRVRGDLAGWVSQGLAAAPWCRIDPHVATCNSCAVVVIELVEWAVLQPNTVLTDGRCRDAVAVGSLEQLA